MVQNHLRWTPTSCSCVIDILKDSDTGNETLFAIRNLCDAHRPEAIPDPDFQTKKAAALAKRYQDLDDNLNRNLADIDAYTELQMSDTEKAGCRSTVERLTAERKREYDLLLSQPDSNLYFCVNVHSQVKEEGGRFSKIYDRIKAQYNLTDAQMQTITYSFSGVAPNRVITVDFNILLTANQKNAARTWCDANIGIGRVIIL